MYSSFSIRTSGQSKPDDALFVYLGCGVVGSQDGKIALILLSFKLCFVKCNLFQCCSQQPCSSVEQTELLQYLQLLRQLACWDVTGHHRVAGEGWGCATGCIVTRLRFVQSLVRIFSVLVECLTGPGTRLPYSMETDRCRGL